MMYSQSSLKSVVRAFTVAAVFASVLAPTASFASSLNVPNTHALMSDKQAKPIHFSVRNQTGASVDLRAGDQVMTVAAGKTMDLKLAPGTRIVSVNKTDKYEAGAVICEVSSSLKDSTVVLN